MCWAKNYLNNTEYAVSRWLGFRGGPITIRGEDFTSYEVAVLVALFKLQSTWPHSLDWTVTSYLTGPDSDILSLAGLDNNTFKL